MPATPQANRRADARAPARSEVLCVPPRTQLHVGIVDEEMPYPPNSGKRIRTLNLLLRLAPRHRITLVCHRSRELGEHRLAEEFLRSKGIEVVTAESTLLCQSVLSRGFGFYCRLAGNLLSSRPFVVDSNCSVDLMRAVRNYDLAHRVDLWQAEWTPYCVTLQDIEPRRRIVMAHNVESLIWRRYEQHEPNLFKKLYIAEQRRKFERFERRTFEQVQRVIAVSNEDAALMRSEFGASRVDVVENGVDLDYFHPDKRRRRPQTVLFLGSLDWRPNLDAVDILLSSIMPRVRSKLPGATLQVVGRKPPAMLQDRIRGIPWAELHADVDDVRPFLWEATLMAVPLRIGGGSRLKILEALATETPVVSTRVGAEGLALEHGREITLVEDPFQMADSLVAAMDRPAALVEHARAGRGKVTSRYGWDALANRLHDVWSACSNEK